ncbi:MAG TPA: aminoglycoside 6'-N-acetyltransferase [Acidobacteriaceae bacterium]|jgi:aminoglycoside 6'-N-acetyltransferase I|nr:aminoglycoside 6'-N-acetyltransferase [Acidobacteriaceae bacterium]
MSGGFRIEAPTASTLPAWRQMRQALWPEMTEEENARETEAMTMASSRFLVRVALNQQGEPAGFVEATLRNDYVNGCTTSPVVFLEGIYVEPRARRQGIARSLVDAVEGWGRQMGCSELASDALLENSDSHAMHRGLGFEETERVVYFRRDLGP